MKTEIHPKYTTEAKVKCACGNEFVTGSTKPEIEVEICYNCHPFYTGKEKLIDIAGRVDTVGKVERFKARRAKAKTTAPRSKKVKQADRKKKKEEK